MKLLRNFIMGSLLFLAVVLSLTLWGYILGAVLRFVNWLIP